MKSSKRAFSPRKVGGGAPVFGGITTTAARKIAGIILMDDGVYDELDDSRIAINDWPEVYLRAEIDHAELQFSVSRDGLDWQAIGPVLDASKLSDDYHQGLHFTGIHWPRRTRCRRPACSRRL